MANKQSAKKAVRSSGKRRLANKSVKSSISTRSKQALLAIESGNVENAVKSIRLYEKVASRAGRRGILSRFAVSRKVSRLASKLKAIIGNV
ncbi:MAG: 30S ribosomal protein S20 [Alphaproteobacteria bacterium]|nr:30S ribosomal protein S20 [Rickettsiales bacterium]